MRPTGFGGPKDLPPSVDRARTICFAPIAVPVDDDLTQVSPLTRQQGPLGSRFTHLGETGPLSQGFKWVGKHSEYAI